MEVAVLVYDTSISKWKYKEEIFTSFIEGLKNLSEKFTTIGWAYFSNDEKHLYELIETKSKDGIPEMVSFGSHLFLENSEYLEPQNPYFNSFSLDEKQTFDTWRVRSNCGYISASVVRNIKDLQFPLSYKIALGVLGYIAYRLGAMVGVSFNEKLSSERIEGLNDKEYIEVISYIKKKQWIFFYALSRFLFDGKLLLPLKYFRKNNFIQISNNANLWKSLKSADLDNSNSSVDVVIPTLGRADFVYQTLLDLNKQDVEINSVIIVEQKLPDQEKTLLQKTLEHKWKFKIDHVLLEELGLCNARNIGLNKSKADYILMLDDDIRIDDQPDILQNLIKKLEVCKAQVVSFASDNKQGNTFAEMSYFVSGCSFLIRNKNILPFNLQIEGFGSDDQEYNCNVRANYQRVVYTNEEYINHLRAPMGGWRFDAKAFLPWFKEGVVPLPGPVTLHRYLLYSTENQLKGYKFFTFFKYYKFKIWKYYIFKKRWNKSLFWAKEILADRVKIDIKSGVLKGE